MPSTDDDSGGKSVRQRIIEQAQIETHDARSTVIKTQLLAGGVPRDQLLSLQNAILQYYYALRPLREEDPVEGWWDDVQLSEAWTDGTRIEREVVGDLQTGPRIQTQETPNHVTGLETLHDLAGDTETVRRVSTGLCGRREETEERQRVLDVRILLDVSLVLDDAADRLGFAPDIEEFEEVDEVDDSDIEQFFESNLGQSASADSAAVADGGGVED